MNKWIFTNLFLKIYCIYDPNSTNVWHVMRSEFTYQTEKSKTMLGLWTVHRMCSKTSKIWKKKKSLWLAFDGISSKSSTLKSYQMVNPLTSISVSSLTEYIPLKKNTITYSSLWHYYFMDRVEDPEQVPHDFLPQNQMCRFIKESNNWQKHGETIKHHALHSDF